MKNESFPPLTEKASKLFRNLVDVNWELLEYQEKNRNSNNFFAGLLKINEEYTRVKDELIEEIGEDHFNHFMDMGRKMFS